MSHYHFRAHLDVIGDSEEEAWADVLQAIRNAMNGNYKDLLPYLKVEISGEVYRVNEKGQLTS